MPTPVLATLTSACCRIRCAVLLATLLLLASPVQAQRFRNISTNEGLSSAVAFHVVQDRQGYIWAATTRGVCRYNGHSFKVFPTKKLIDTEVVLKFWPDDYGRFWGVGLNGQLLIIDEGELYPYQYNDSLMALRPEITNDPRVYFDTTTSKLHLYVNNGHVVVDSTGHTQRVQETEIDGTVIRDHNGILYIYDTGNQTEQLQLQTDDRVLTFPGIARSRLYYGHKSGNGYYGSSGKDL